MAIKQPVKRRRGRPLKEESNAIAVEKAILDGNSELIGMIPDAIKVLKSLLTTQSTKDNIKESVAKYVLEKGNKLNEKYNEEDLDNTDRISETGDKEDGSSGFKKPFTTDIIPFSKTN